jgi:hypothetical protein
MKPSEPLGRAKIGACYLAGNPVGATGFEPVAPRLRRNFTVAGRRPPSPEEPASWTLRRQTSRGVAGRLPPLAPRLAPGMSLALLMDGGSSRERAGLG